MDKMQQARQLEEEAQRLRRVAHEEARVAELKARDEWEKNNKADVYIASDYAGMVSGPLQFYFGYEHTVCTHHKTEDECSEADCGDNEWAFVAWKDDKEVMRIPQSKLNPRKNEDTSFYLLSGIAMYLGSAPLSGNEG